MLTPSANKQDTPETPSHDKIILMTSEQIVPENKDVARLESLTDIYLAAGGHFKVAQRTQVVE
jgi:hypothetical protein